MDKNKSLYFVSVVPPEPIYNQILDWKEYFAENHHSKAALKSPPHITLHMPFRWPEKRELEIINSLERVADDHSPFNTQLKNFGAFEPRVIFIEVMESNHLRKLQEGIGRSFRKDLNVFNDDYKNRGFTPHVTVAFRDLKKSEFLKAWERVKDENFEAQYITEELCLLKHDGLRWNIHKRVLLSQSN